MLSLLQLSETIPAAVGAFVWCQLPILSSVLLVYGPNVSAEPEFLGVRNSGYLLATSIEAEDLGSIGLLSISQMTQFYEKSVTEDVDSFAIGATITSGAYQNQYQVIRSPLVIERAARFETAGLAAPISLSLTLSVQLPVGEDGMPKEEAVGEIDIAASAGINVHARLPEGHLQIDFPAMLGSPAHGPVQLKLEKRDELQNHWLYVHLGTFGEVAEHVRAIFPKGRHRLVYPAKYSDREIYMLAYLTVDTADIEEQVRLSN